MLLRKTARFALNSMLRNGLPSALAVILVSQADAQIVEGLASQTENAPIGSPTPGGGALSAFSFTASGTLSETYTSNGLGVPRSSGLATGADFVTRASLNLGLHKRAARFEGDLQYTLAGYAYVHNSSLNTVSNYLNALGRAVLVPEHVLLDVRAFAAPVLISRLGPLSADDRPTATGTNSGRRDTYGYTISPDFLFRLGDFATSETTFSQGSVFFFDPGGPEVDDSIPGESAPTQTTVYGVTERFSSGNDFGRLAWTLGATASKSTRIGGDLEQAAGTADLSYALSRQVALLGTAGYASLTSSSQVLTHSLVGPIAIGGLAINLGPSFSAEFRAGWQFNYNTYNGRIHYELGPSTTLSGSLSDSVTTPALRLLGGLGQLNVNGQGDFFDTAYQLDDDIPTANVSEISVFNPVPIDGIGMGGGAGQISRYRAGRLSLLHQAERTQYRLTIYRTLRDPLVELVTVPLPREDSTGVDALISRNLNRVLTGTASAGYSVHNVLNGQNTIFRTRAELTYLMTPVMTSFLRAAYLHRLSDDSLVAVSRLSDNLSDVSITIGIQRQFF